MDSSSEGVEAEGDGAAGDATSLYSVIKAQGMLTSKPKFVAVRPSSRASISSARSARSSISPIIEEDEDKESEIRQKNDQNDERPKDKSLDDGSIKLHSLSSKMHIIIPETIQTPQIPPLKPLQNNYLARQRTAFATVIHRIESSRPSTAASTLSSISMLSSGTRASSGRSGHERVRPLTQTQTQGQIQSQSRNSAFSLSAPLQRIYTASFMTLNEFGVSVGEERAKQLRVSYQLPPPPEEEDYNEWREGMADPTEEARNARELSETFYYKEQEFLSPEDQTSEFGLKYNLAFGRIAEFCPSFILLPVPPDFNIRCRLSRSRTGIDGKLFPSYYLHLERKGRPEVLLLTAKRSKLSRTNYVISTNPADLAKKSDACVGVLEANLRGTEFVLKIPSTEEFIDAGRAEGEEQVIQLVKRRREWESLLKLKYEQDPLGMKGPRRICVTIPKLKSDWQRAVPASLESSDVLVSTIKNRMPTWDPNAGNFTLNFQGRVEKSSVKNFQLAPEGVDVTLLQFGKLWKDGSFILDFHYPFCPLQAFAIALSGFDNRIGID